MPMKEQLQWLCWDTQLWNLVLVSCPLTAGQSSHTLGHNFVEVSHVVGTVHLNLLASIFNINGNLQLVNSYYIQK